MPVVSVVEIEAGRDGGYNDRREREYTRTFSVTVSLATDGPEVACFAPGVPRTWTPYVPKSGVADLGSLCREVKAEPTASPYVWTVRCHYSSRMEPGNKPEAGQIEAPELRPAEVSWDTTTVAVPLTYDTGGWPIHNSAGDPFDPPPEVEESRLVLRVVRNYLKYRPLFYETYHDTLNSKPFLGFRPGHVRCGKIPGTRQYENGLFFWKVSFEFTIRRERVPLGAKHTDGLKSGPNRSLAWTRWLLDRGYRDADGKPLKDPVSFQPLTSPGLLDGDGSQLDPSEQPVYLGFEVFPLLDFNKLNLFR